MSRFARTTEEAFLRHKELAEKVDDDGKPKVDKNGKPLPAKGALQTFYLYQLLLMNSWATGYFEKKNYSEFCERYGLDPDNTYRRLKVLRTKGWTEETPSYIRPLLIHRGNNSKTVKTTEAVKTTVDSGSETVKITARNDEKAVKITANNCKNYSQSSEKAVKITVKNAATHDEISDSGDSKIFKDLKSNYDSTTSTSSSDKFLSEFSLEECLAWINLRIKNGEEIETPERMARWARKTGEADAFISAALYPDGFDRNGKFRPRRLNQDQRDYYLKNLRTLSDEEFDADGWREQFTSEDWAWLMANLERVEK